MEQISSGQTSRDFYTYKQLAERWSVCEHTVYKRTAELPRLQMGRKVLIPSDAVLAWEMSHMAPGPWDTITETEAQ